MKIMMSTLLILLMSVSAPTLAHRFSTSFLTLSAATDGAQTWTWRIVEHDLETLTSALQADAGDMQFAGMVKRLITVNEGCEVQLEQPGNTLKTVYAGQTYVDLKGQIICANGNLSDLSVETVFSSISDHKVVLAIPTDATKQVLSLSQANWKK